MSAFDSIKKINSKVVQTADTVDEGILKTAGKIAAAGAIAASLSGCGSNNHPVETIGGVEHVWTSKDAPKNTNTVKAESGKSVQAWTEKQGMKPQFTYHYYKPVNEETEELEQLEEELTASQIEKREQIVRALKRNKAGFEDKYGKDAKSVMYATATKLAKLHEGRIVVNPDDFDKAQDYKYRAGKVAGGAAFRQLMSKYHAHMANFHNNHGRPKLAEAELLKAKEFATEGVVTESAGTGSQASAHNQHYADAYETLTALHLHHMTGSKDNKDAAHVKRMHELSKKGEDAFNKLPDHLKDRALHAAKKSADAYLGSLKHNHGIKPEDVSEVHHTNKGIGHLLGYHVPQNKAPHDVVVKTKKGELHGASLKATSGTASNNTPEAAVPGLNTHYAEAAKKAGLEGKTKAERKELVKADPKYAAKAKEATVEAAAKHKTYFNSLSHKDQLSHVHHMMRYNDKPDIHLDYVNGQKGKSVPYHELHHIKMANSAKKFSMEHDAKSNMVKIYTHNDKGEKHHLLTVEHRYTHGPFNAPQANAKFSAHKED